MEGMTEMVTIVQNQGIKAEYILFILRNLSRHISKVEERLETLQQVFTKDDFEHLFTSISSLKNFLDDVIAKEEFIETPRHQEFKPNTIYLSITPRYPFHFT